MLVYKITYLLRRIMKTEVNPQHFCYKIPLNFLLRTEGRMSFEYYRNDILLTSTGTHIFLLYIMSIPLQYAMSFNLFLASNILTFVGTRQDIIWTVIPISCNAYCIYESSPLFTGFTNSSISRPSLLL